MRARADQPVEGDGGVRLDARARLAPLAALIAGGQVARKRVVGRHHERPGAEGLEVFEQGVGLAGAGDRGQHEHAVVRLKQLHKLRRVELVRYGKRRHLGLLHKPRKALLRKSALEGRRAELDALRQLALPRAHARKGVQLGRVQLGLVPREVQAVRVHGEDGLAHLHGLLVKHAALAVQHAQVRGVEAFLERRLPAPRHKVELLAVDGVRHEHAANLLRDAHRLGLAGKSQRVAPLVEQLARDADVLVGQELLDVGRELRAP